jgi:hypothetical protein
MYIAANISRLFRTKIRQANICTAVRHTTPAYTGIAVAAGITATAAVVSIRQQILILNTNDIIRRGTAAMGIT